MNKTSSDPIEPSTRAEVTLTALRRNSDGTAAALRRDLPAVLGRLIAEVPGAVLELKMATAEHGCVGITMAVEAGPQTEALMVQVSEVVDCIAEVVPGGGADAADVDVWPVVASAAPARLGFGVSGTTASPTSVPLDHEVDLVRLVSPHAGVGVRVRMWAVSPDGSGKHRWGLEFAVLTRVAAPSLRLRAELRHRLPNFEIGRRDDRASVLGADAAELPALFAIPVAGTETIPGVRLGGAAAIPMQPSGLGVAVDENWIRLGSAVNTAGHVVDVHLSPTERLRHVHVIGRTGTGKSSFLAGFVHRVARGLDGALVLDPHGQLVDRIIAELPDSAIDRTLLIRCGDTANPVPLNPLAETDTVRREIAIDDVCEMFQTLFDKKHSGIVGPRFRERVAMGLRALAAVHGPRASLLDVPVALSNHAFLTAAVKTSGDDRLKAWLRNEAASKRSNEYGELVAWVNSKFEPFASTTALRAILGSGEDAIDLAGAMDDGRIVLVDLSKSTLGESATRLLGYLYLNRTWVSALRRAERGRPFTVVVDEAQAMVSGALAAMLSEGRKFGLSVVLAHQYLGQLDEDLRPAVDGNVATTVAFRGSVADTAELRQRFGGQVESSTLMTLPDLSSIVLRSASGVHAEPHTLTVDHNSGVEPRSGAALRRVDAALRRRRDQDLVDPFRERTAAAAAGRSNVSAPPAPGEQRVTAERPNFLDDWIARRLSAPSPSADDAASA